ncbi:MAG: RsbRD N-terminal domain-containing protein [Desulfobacterales bacterium]
MAKFFSESLGTDGGSGIRHMGVEILLAERKSAVVKKWFEHVVDTYPPDTAKFLKQQKDPFANPVGSTTMESLKGVFDEMLKAQPDRDLLSALLDPVIRIRAVQAMFTPSQAVSFIFFLKQIVRQETEKELKDRQKLTDLQDFEKKIDELALIAFNIYMQCAQTIFQLKASHEKSKIYSAFSRAGLVEEIPEDGPGF